MGNSPFRRTVQAACAAVLVAALASAGAPRADELRLRQGTAPSQMNPAQLDKLIRLHHTETEQVRLVLLPTTVTDKRGRILDGLERDQFRVYEDGVAQRIRYFSSESTEPVSIAFLLDVSGSMRQLDKLVHAKEAIRFFVDQLRPDDRFGLICFADDQVAWITEFTSDRERFMKRLSVQEGFGQTALHDAVAAAPGLVDASIRGRKALVLITDGVDNTSRLTMEQAIEVARRVEVPVYTIGFLTVDEAVLKPGEVTTNLEVLRTVSDETGGRLFPVFDPDDLKEAVNSLDTELRHQYVVGYYPADVTSPGFRRIRLDVERRGARVHTRTGYYLAGDEIATNSRPF